MMEYDKVSLKLRRVIEKSADQLKNLLGNEMRAINRDAENRAHIATLGDRPFVGAGTWKPEVPSSP